MRLYLAVKILCIYINQIKKVILFIYKFNEPQHAKKGNAPFFRVAAYKAYKNRFAWFYMGFWEVSGQ